MELCYMSLSATPSLYMTRTQEKWSPSLSEEVTKKTSFVSLVQKMGKDLQLEGKI